MRFLTVIAISLISACGSLESSQRIETGGTEVGGVMIAGIGDTILEIKKEESLPNIFGKADVYGRKRPTGVIYLVYAGISDGMASFTRRDISITSEKTAMNSSPIIIPNTNTSTVSGYANGEPVYGTVTTSAPPTVVQGAVPADKITGVNELLLRVTPTSSDALVVEGHMLKVIEATENIVRYTIEKLR